MDWEGMPSFVKKPREVLKLVVIPLVTCLFTCSVSLNILIFILVNFRKFAFYSLVLSYVSGICAAASFVFCMFAVIYGNYIFLACCELFQAVLLFSMVGILANFWELKSLCEDDDYMVFNVMKYFFTILVIFTVLLQIRVAYISFVLGKKMFKKGTSWDLEELDSTDYPKHHTMEVL